MTNGGIAQNVIASYQVPSSRMEASSAKLAFNGDDRRKKMIRERLAAYAHTAWAEYMEYFLDRLERDQMTGCRVIPPEYERNLRELINTPYPDLTPEQKDNDREQADRMIEEFRDLRSFDGWWRRTKLYWKVGMEDPTKPFWEPIGGIVAMTIEMWRWK